MTKIGPVTTPLGTTAPSRPLLVTLTLVAAVPLKLTEAPRKFVPRMVTVLPTGLLVGVKLETKAGRKKRVALVKLPSLVLTLINPVAAPFGTLTTNCVKVMVVGVAVATPLNRTVGVLALRLAPLIVTLVPTGPNP